MANTTIYPYGTNGQLPSSIGVINDLITGGADKALSAEMGKRLRKAITGLLNALSPTAFTGEKPTDTDLDIYAPKFTITLPTDTRVDMTNQNAQVEAGDSYTNTFSLNETAEEGYVLLLSATMEGGGEISADATTGVVSTNNVTGNITITASAGVPPMKVHSYDRSHIEGTAEEPPRHFVDQVGNFDLYLQADAGYNVTYYPAGYYANGKNDGYRYGYGNRELSIASGGDFTIALKGVAIQRNSGQAASYNSNQLVHRFYDRQSLNVGFSDKVGQFQIQLSSTDDVSSFTTGVMYPHIAYQAASATVYKRFYESGTTGTVAYNDGKTYSMVIAYNSSSKTATAWVVKDSSGTKTLHLCGTISIPDGLILPCIAIQNSALLNGGLDVYNFAMTEQQVATEFDATIS